MLFYRDDVSDGQYRTVGINELAAIQETPCFSLLSYQFSYLSNRITFYHLLFRFLSLSFSLSKFSHTGTFKRLTPFSFTG